MRHAVLVGILLLAQTLSGVRSQRALTKTMSTDTELFLVDDLTLKEQVIPALSDFLDRGDPSAAKRLLAETVASHQFQAALTRDGPRAEYLAKDSADLLDGRQPKEVTDFRNTGEVLRDPGAIRRYQAEGTLNRFLVLVLCERPLERTHPRINLSRGALAEYVRTRSRWADEMLSLSNEFLWNAQALQPPIGGDARLLTRDEAVTMLKAFQEIPRPSEDVKLIEQFDALKEILEVAITEPRYRVLILTN